MILYNRKSKRNKTMNNIESAFKNKNGPTAPVLRSLYSHIEGIYMQTCSHYMLIICVIQIIIQIIIQFIPFTTYALIMLQCILYQPI